jgi:hypothetical protein
MVDPRTTRLRVWENAIDVAQRQLAGVDRCLAHPGNTALDTMYLTFQREVAACYHDSLKATYRKISGE